MSDEVTVDDDGNITPYAPDKPELQMELRGPQSLNAPALDTIIIPFAPCPPPALTDEKAYMTSKNDKQGYRFRAFNNMSRGTVQVCRTEPNGTEAWWAAAAPAPYGFTGGIGLSATGDRLLVDSLLHDIVNPRPRANPRAEGSIGGVYHEDTAAPEDGPGAFVVSGDPVPGPAPAPAGPTPAEIVAAFATALTTPHNPLLGALGNLIKGKASEGVTTAIVGPLDSYFRDRNYQGGLSAQDAYAKGTRPPPDGWK
jgi:hypothetical protein